MDFCWKGIHHSVVKELAWSLFSPAIVECSDSQKASAWHIPFNEEAAHILRELNQQPAPLISILESRRDQRLGARFEALWAFFLNAHSGYQVLAHDYQINDRAGKTLGALDFLVEDFANGEIVHIELAVKFYLHYGNENSTGLDCWIGPNPDDSLETKIRHLLDHQLPLSTYWETRDTLKKHGLPIPSRRVGIIKGFLFHPCNENCHVLLPVNKEHLKGKWAYWDSKDFKILTQRHPDFLWTIVDKQAWLDPEPPVNLDSEALTEALAGIFTKQKGETVPVMIQGKTLSNQNSDIHRYFIAPPSWPEN